MMIKRYVDHQYQLPEYNYAADFEWIQNQSKMPWLCLNLSVPTDMIMQEIANIEHLLSSHRNSQYNEHQGWKSFCIHGKSYDAIKEDNYYNDSRLHSWTPEAVALMPNTVKYFQREWPGNTFFRIRVMLLEPGGYISIHSDSEISKLSPINIAITQPDNCVFVVEKYGTVPFKSGTAFWLDVSNNHAVVNNSPLPRWHIIVHQIFDKDFQNIAVNSYKKLYNC